MTNPTSRGQQRDKPYRDALRMVAKSIDNGDIEGPINPYPRGSLRAIAFAQLMKAEEETVAAKEIADRLDGKVAQPVGGDEELPPVGITIMTGVPRANED